MPGVDPTRIDVDVIATTPLDLLRGFERLVRLVLAYNNYRSGIAKCLFMADNDVNKARLDWYSGWLHNKGLASVLRASLGSRQYDKLVGGTGYDPEHGSTWPRPYEELRLSSKDAAPKWRDVDSVREHICLSWTSNCWANALHYNLSENKCALDYFVPVDSVVLKDWADKQYCVIGLDMSSCQAVEMIIRRCFLSSK